MLSLPCRLKSLTIFIPQLIGEPGYKAFEDQVRRYVFKTSLFDTVVSSLYPSYNIRDLLPFYSACVLLL